MSTATTPQVALEKTEASSARWLVLVGALMVQLILGTVYGYSVFWQPLEAYIWPAVMTEADAAAITATGQAIPEGTLIAASAAEVAAERTSRIGYLKYAFAICILSFAGAMVFAGRLQDIKGPRFTAILGAFFIAVAFLIASQVGRLGAEPMARVVVLWITIGLIAGVGIGFAYVCPIAALVKWFPNNKGLVSGLAVAGFGLGALIFSSKTLVGAVGFIEAYGIAQFYAVHALICGGIVIVGALLLRNPPIQPAAAGSGAPSAASSDATWQQLLRSGRFYVIWIMFFSGAMAGLMVIGILKPFAGNQLVKAAETAAAALSDATRNELLLKGAAAVGILAIFNAAGRVIWGFVSDRIGRAAAMFLMFTAQGITLLILITLDSQAQLAVGAALVGFNFGGNFALFPSLTADLFGAKNLGANYGWVFTSYGVAGVIGIWAGNMALDKTGSYFAAFAVAAGLCFLSAILALILQRVTRVRA